MSYLFVGKCEIRYAGRTFAWIQGQLIPLTNSKEFSFWHLPVCNAWERIENVIRGSPHGFGWYASAPPPPIGRQVSWNRRFGFVIVLCFTAFAANRLAVWTKSPTAKPILASTKPTTPRLDLGEFPEEEYFTHLLLLSSLQSVFPAIDTGRIAKAQSPCNCVSIPSASSQEIAIEIKVPLDNYASLYFDKPKYSIEVPVQLTMEDGTIRVLHVVASFRRRVSQDLASMHFGTACRVGTEAPIRTLKVTCHSEASGLEAEVDGAIATAKLEKQSNTSYFVSIQPDTKRKPGEYSGMLRLRTVAADGRKAFGASVSIGFDLQSVDALKEEQQ